VQEVANAYVEKINRSSMFGWGGAGALLCRPDCTQKPDGTLLWAGLREFKMDGSDPATGAAHVSAVKKVIDVVVCADEELGLKFVPLPQRFVNMLC
jgi:hypothetical protein